MKASKVSALTILFFFAVFMLIPVPQVQGALTTSDVVVSFTAPYGTVNHVQTDSSGNIYYGNELGNIYKSTDGGSTWSAWFNEENSTDNFVYMILPASNGSWFVGARGGGNPIWQSNDDGATWSSSYAGVTNDIWHYGEMSNGTLIMNPYGSTDNDVLYATDDFGDNWRQINLSTLVTGWSDAHHIHSVRVNPTTQEIWVATGDVGDDIQLIKYNSTGWFMMGQGLGQYWKCDIGFDDTYVYFLSDTGDDKITRMAHAGNVTTDQVDVLRSDQWTGGTHFGKYIERVDGLLFASTRHGTMWASWDGEHWVALVDNDSASGYRPENFAWYRSVDNAIIACDKAQNVIYKFYVDEAVLKHLFFKDSVSVSGSTVTFTQTLKSGSDSAIDLSDYGVDSATVKLTGVSHNLIASNGTFESGALSGWYERWNTISVTSSEAYAGSYSLNFTQGKKNSKWLSVRPPEFSTGVSSGGKYQDRRNFIYIISLWAKSNVSSTDAYAVQARFKNESGTDQQATKDLNPLDTTWRQYVFVYICPSSYDEVIFSFTNNYANGQVLFVDNFLIEAHEAQMYDEGGLGKQYFGGWVSSMFTANQTTTSPSVTFQSQTKSHSGSLANNTDSTSTSIILTSGVYDITTSVTGSSLVKVTVTGTQTFGSTNVFLHGQIESGLYNASYFGTVSFSGTAPVLVMADQNTTITAGSLTSIALTFTVTGYSGLTSTTKVYCGGRGEPSSVSGADSSSYDNQILTLTASHASSKSMSVSWGGKASGQYLLIVYVKKDGMPYPNAVVSVDGEEKGTDFLGQTSFELTTGTYFVEASIDQQTKNKTVTVHDSTSIGFEFQTIQAIYRAPVTMIEIAIVVVGAIITWFFVIPMVLRRRK